MSTATKEMCCVNPGEDAFVEQLNRETTHVPAEPSHLELPYAPLDVVKAWLEERGIRGSVQNIHCVRQGLAHILEPEHWAHKAE